MESQAPLAFASHDSSADHPPFIRAASAIRRWNGRLAIVQDDVHVLAVGALETPSAFEPVLLPPGAGGRRRFEERLGNRDAKLDLEALAVLPDGRLVAFGSGSRPEREALVIVDARRRVTVKEAPDWYAYLRSEVAFAGSELNVEGALVDGGRLWLVQRGNGAAGGGVAPVNALGSLPLDAFLRWLDGNGAAPRFTAINRVDLGEIGGARLTFTDLARGAGGALVFIACAEASPDVVRDGEVEGCCIGVMDAAGVRLGAISGADTAMAKLEGLEPYGTDPNRFAAVSDADNPDAPAIGSVLQLTDAAR